MAESTALVPVEFHGAALTVTTINSTPFVALRPICEDLGLVWVGQLQRIKRHPVLSSTVCVTHAVAEDGKQREMVMLPLDKLNGWLFGVSVGRVKPELRARLTQYQAECFDVLAGHFGVGTTQQIQANGNPGQLPNALRQTQQPELPGIDVRMLLLSGQCNSQTYTREIYEAIDKQAWAMAGEAFELLREHLRRRVAFMHTSGIERRLHEKAALQDIKTVTLGQALAHTYISEMRYALSGISIAVTTASNAEKRVREQIAQLTEQRQNGAAT